jgi:transcriptional regulator with XRE-family HTH domain
MTRKTRAKAESSSEPGIDPEVLRSARIKKKWTQAELVFATREAKDPDFPKGIDQSLLSKLENGTDRDVGVKLARLLARVLGLSMDTLCGR